MFEKLKGFLGISSAVKPVVTPVRQMQIGSAIYTIAENPYSNTGEIIVRNPTNNYQPYSSRGHDVLFVEAPQGLEPVEAITAMLENAPKYVVPRAIVGDVKGIVIIADTSLSKEELQGLYNMGAKTMAGALTNYEQLHQQKSEAALNAKLEKEDADLPVLAEKFGNLASLVSTQLEWKNSQIVERLSRHSEFITAEKTDDANSLRVTIRLDNLHEQNQKVLDSLEGLLTLGVGLDKGKMSFRSSDGGGYGMSSYTTILSLTVNRDEIPLLNKAADLADNAHELKKFGATTALSGEVTKLLKDVKLTAREHASLVANLPRTIAETIGTEAAHEPVSEYTTDVLVAERGKLKGDILRAYDKVAKTYGFGDANRKDIVDSLANNTDIIDTKQGREQSL